MVSRWRTDGSSDNTAPVQAEDTLVATFKSTIRPPRIPEVSSDCDTDNLKSERCSTFVSTYRALVKR